MTIDNSIAAARVTNGSKIYGSDETEVRALDDVTVEFEKGKFTAIMGPSGSGKSTLMHCSAGLDDLTSGTVHIGETELGSLSDKDLTLLRRNKVGFVFQAFNLLPTLTAKENDLLNVLVKGKGKTIDRFILINNLKLGARGIDITISRLRKKIENNPKVPSYIITIRGEGYALPKSLLEIQ